MEGPATSSPNGESNDACAHQVSDIPFEWPSEAIVERASGYFRAVSDPPRLVLLARLLHGEACVTELAAEFDVSLPTVSQRLKALLQAGLIARRREGKHVYYSVADDHVVRLIGAAIEHASE